MKTSARIQVETKTTQTVDLDLEVFAAWFCEMSDDDMAKLLSLIADRMIETFEPDKADMQWFFVGRHMKKCECTSENGRAMINEIHRAMTGD